MTRGAGFGAGKSPARRRRPLVGAAFTPLSLSPTAWYDPSDITTLFQDSAGTTPVTASGQPVGRMSDKSGNGNHMLQGTAAARPIYTVAGAVKYLQFDGVDDGLAATLAANLTGGAVTGAWAGRYDTGGPGTGWFLAMALGVVESYDNANGATLALSITGNTRVIHNNINGTNVAVTIDTDTVLQGSIDATNFKTQKDAAAAVANAHGLSPSFNSSRVSIGINTNNTNPSLGRCHGVVLLSRVLTAPENANLVTYLGAKQGRVL